MPVELLGKTYYTEAEAAERIGCAEFYLTKIRKTGAFSYQLLPGRGRKVFYGPGDLDAAAKAYQRRPIITTTIDELRQISAEVAASRHLPPFPQIKVLSLTELRALEVASAVESYGVYFLWHDDQLVYVGQSACVSYRVEAHSRWKRNRRLAFDAATALRAAWPYHLAVEAVYIEHYKPPENRL